MSARRWLNEGRWRDAGPVSASPRATSPALVWIDGGSPEWTAGRASVARLRRWIDAAGGDFRAGGHLPQFRRSDREVSMRYDFQSKLYKTAEEMCRAIASTWLSPGGRNDPKQTAAFLAYRTNEQLADDAIKGLGLDCRENRAKNTEPPTWMDEHGITHGDIVSAFAWFRKIFDERLEVTK